MSRTSPFRNCMPCINGDFARKNALVEFGFRLPSAYDNRPLKFDETYARIEQVIYVSATPANWEIQEVGRRNRRTGDPSHRPLDPEIEVRPAQGQVDDALAEIRHEVAKGGQSSSDHPDQTPC